jgi:hypothetical protein
MSSRGQNIRAGAVLAGLLVAGAAQAANPVTGAFGETKPLVDLRLRYENVQQEATPALNTANALTLRARLGFETGKAWNTALLAEIEAVAPLMDNYRADNAVAGVKTNLPVVADPEDQEINRLQLTNTSIANTTITLGRQRINLDDQRFIGNVGWRQNEQTYDALRVVNRSIANLVIDGGYIRQVNRVFGPDSPQSPYKGDSYYGNVSYQFKVGKLSGFTYLLDFDPITTIAAGLNPARVATSTYGARFAGDRPVGRIKLGYIVSWATQSDRGRNPLQIDNDYRLLELTATWRQFSFGLGNEVLEGDGTAGFATPLATLHKFQGWVDKFLTTPANGIDDRYASLTWMKKGVGPLDTLTAVVTYHDYRPERIAGDYGHEFNASLSAKYHRFNGMLKYGSYKADAATPLTVARDTRKFWAQLEFAY